MRPEDQTTEVKEKLYALTKMFVYKHQPHYYKQYQGDLDDLAGEFYSEFLTPKSKELGKEQTLLDKYDVSLKPANLTEEKFFANLVMKCVVRMLIDRSRADRYQYKSIDHFVDEFGDIMIKTFNLSTEFDPIQIEDYEFSESFVRRAQRAVSDMSESCRLALSEQYAEMRSALAPNFQSFFDKVIPAIPIAEVPADVYYSIQLSSGDKVLCLCQQITSKTVCLLYNGEIINFDRVSGACRMKAHYGKCLTLESLEEIKSVSIYKCKYDRNAMLSVDFCTI